MTCINSRDGKWKELDFQGWRLKTFSGAFLQASNWEISWPLFGRFSATLWNTKGPICVRCIGGYREGNSTVGLNNDA